MYKDFAWVWLTDEKPGHQAIHRAMFRSFNPTIEQHQAVSYHNWRNNDRSIRDWWISNRGRVAAETIVFADYDVFVNCDLTELIKPVEGVGGRSMIYTSNPGWCWFREIKNLPSELKRNACGIAPLAVTIWDRKSLDLIASSEFDTLFSLDIFCELRTGTLLHHLGIPLYELSDFVNLRAMGAMPSRFDQPSLWHPIKKPVNPYHMSEYMQLATKSKILHQVWIQGEDSMPEAFKENRKAWRRALPVDWEMRLWDEAAARAEWTDYEALSAKCFHHATRADIILARAQRDHGGLACGTDVIPLRIDNLMKWIEANDTLVIINPRAQSSSNGLSYSAFPNHPFWCCLCRHQLRNDAGELPRANVWAATGPGCWYHVVQSHKWDLALAMDNRAYGKMGEPGVAWVDPGCAGSWHGGASPAIKEQ